MKRRFSLSSRSARFAVVCAASVGVGFVILGGAANAQGAGTGVGAGPAADANAQNRYFQDRVTAGLATDGIVLSRLGYALEIEMSGNTAFVTLTDTASGKTVATQRVKDVAGNREAAVAMLVQTAGAMIEQAKPGAGPKPQPAAHATQGAGGLGLSGRAEGAGGLGLSGRAGGTAAPVDVRVTEDADLARRVREYRNKRFALTAVTTVSGNRYGVSSSTSWVPVRGELGAPVAAPDFYRIVGRDDYARTFERQRSKALWLGLGGTTASFVVMLAAIPARDSGFAAPLVIGGGIGVIAFPMASFVAASSATQPMEINLRLAEEYNERLRRELRIPDSYAVEEREADPARDRRRFLRVKPATSKPAFAVAPYAAATGGGFAIGGTF